MNTDFSDVTFLIPIRIDSVIRLENILVSIKYLLSHFDTNIVVLEANKYDNHILKKLLPHGVKYIFVEDWDPIFHRTKYINTSFLESNTDIISIWDADVIIPVHQLIESINALRSGRFEVSFPYDGSFFDIPEFIRDIYIESQDIRILEDNINKLSLPYGNSMGGHYLSHLKLLFNQEWKTNDSTVGDQKTGTG